MKKLLITLSLLLLPNTVFGASTIWQNNGTTTTPILSNGVHPSLTISTTSTSTFLGAIISTCFATSTGQPCITGGSGGGGNPGGSSGNIQWNNSGSFGGFGTYAATGNPFTGGASLDIFGDGTAQFNAGGSTIFDSASAFSATGYLGVLTTSPNNPLDVNGNIGNASVGDYQIGDLGSNTWFNAVNGGSVGIGTASPVSKLTVVGTTTSSGYVISNLSNSILAVDSSGNVIATTTPGGGGTNYFTNSSATTSLTTGSILTALTGTFGTINATSTTGTSTFSNSATFGGNVTATGTVSLIGGNSSYLDVWDGSGTGAIRMGADVNSAPGTRSTNTRKVARIVVPTYSVGTNYAAIFGADFTSATANNTYFGSIPGGSNYGSQNIIFATTPNDSTTGGTEDMRITSSGNIGIGTSTPASLLSIAGTAGSSTTLFSVASSSGASFLTVLPSGNVGIGTANPGTILSVIGTTTSSVSVISPMLTSNGTSLILSETGDTFGSMQLSITNRGGAGGIVLQNTSSGVSTGVVDFVLNPQFSGTTAQLNIRDENRSGSKFISAPELQFGPAGVPTFVVGTGFVQFMKTAVGIGLNPVAGTPNNPTAMLQIQGTTTTPLLNVTSSSSVSALYVSNTGNVGIGTTTPATALSVIGTTTTQGLNISNLASTFLAVDPSGNVIATTTPAGGGGSGNSAWTIGNGVIYNATSSDYVGIGTSTPNSALEVDGGIFSKCSLITPSASTTVDFKASPNCVLVSATSTNWTLTWTNATSTLGKTISVYYSSATSGAIASTTFAGGSGSGNIAWNGGINPGTQVLNGLTDGLCFQSLASSTNWATTASTTYFIGESQCPTY